MKILVPLIIILAIVGMYFGLKCRENSTVQYAHEFGLNPVTQPEYHFTTFGTPFNYVQDHGAIYSIVTEKGVMYVRFNGWYDDVVLVDNNGRELNLK